MDFFRKLILVLVAFIMAANCTACAKHVEPSVFVIGVWKGQESVIIEELVRRYPGEIVGDIRIEVVSEDSYYDRLWGYLLSQSPEWDLALARSDWVSRWVDYQAIRPFDGLNTITTSGLSDFLYDDEIYGFPLYEDFPILWLRKDLLEPHYGTFAPATWEEIYAAADSLSNPPERYGLAIALDEHEVGETFLQMFFGFGGEIDLVNSDLHFDSPAGSKAMDFLGLLIDEELTAPVDTRSDQILGLMQAGQAGMGVFWLSESGPLFDCEQSPKLCIEGHPTLAGVVLPHSSNVLVHPYLSRSTGLILPGGSDYPQEAIGFIQWLSTPEGLFALDEARLQVTGIMAEDYILTEIKPEAGASSSVYGFPELFENYLNEMIHMSIMDEKDPGILLEEIDSYYVEVRNRNSRRP